MAMLKKTMTIHAQLVIEWPGDDRM